MATFRGSEYFCYDLSQNPIQSSSDEITLSFKTWQRNGLILHTGKSADYVNLALKDGAVSLVINLGSGAFEAIVEPVSGKFNDNVWHDVKVTRNLRQVRSQYCFSLFLRLHQPSRFVSSRSSIIHLSFTMNYHCMVMEKSTITIAVELPQNSSQFKILAFKHTLRKGKQKDTFLHFIFKGLFLGKP